ncbi:MAG TPA: B-4DMT family transporter [Actinophytocola sp.]|jgi:hypothetical protein|uniref:B-4DMT family transporter n=1 Tax=Actinophytocola sp. TaxID=1872138 RepID=UPI002F925FE9
MRTTPRSWLLRGGVLAVVHAAAETVRTGFGVHHPTSRTLFEAIVLGVLVAVAAVWGAVDTWRDVPERGKVWLIASLVAGWGAAILGIVGKSIFVDQSGVADLGAALTGGAAFTALLVLVPACIGLVVGRWIHVSGRGSREEPDVPQRDGSRSGPRS